MAAPAAGPTGPNTSWTNFENWGVSEAICKIMQERTDITAFRLVFNGEEPSPCPQGVVRLLVNYYKDGYGVRLVASDPPPRIG
jgi:hypothetical protein